MDVIMVEDKTYENEVDKSITDTKVPNIGGKRPGAGRPFGAKTKKIGSPCKKWLRNINILLWIIY
jgi:hypothetical protein